MTRAARFALRLLLTTSLATTSLGGVAFATDGAAPAGPAEVAFWESVRDSADPSELEAYLTAFPQGQFAPLATIRLKKLRDAAGDRATDRATDAQQEPARQEPARADTRAGVPPAPAAKVRGWIGAEVRTLDEKRARELGLAGASGAVIVALVPYGPAASSGLQPNDVVLSIDGGPVVDHADLVRRTSAIAPKQSTSLAVVRGRERLILTLTTGNYFEDQWAAAHRGDPAAMIALSSVYFDGTLVDRNVPEGKAWLERAANAGSAPAMRVLGARYEKGIGLDQNDRAAFDWYALAAAAGDAPSMFALGMLYYRGRAVERDAGKAAKLFEQAAARGHAGAMNNYGLALQDGWPGVEKNEARALEYLRRAAALGEPKSFQAIAQAYYQGKGVARNHAEALRWYRDAAQRGDIHAYAGVGMMYERGEGGVTKDRAEAIRNYRKAAEVGDAFALERLKALKVTLYDPAEVHKLLSDLGFDPGPRSGRRTAEAVRRFQRSRGLPADGEPSLSLVGHLREAVKKKEAAAGAKPAAAAATAAERATPPPDPGGLENLEKLDTPQQ